MFFLAHAIDCIQCSGTDNNDPFQCTEYLEADIDIRPKPCADVFGAQYCIKHTGRFEGTCCSSIISQVVLDLELTAFFLRLLLATSLLTIINTLRYLAASAIHCYQCSSSELLDCADGIIHQGGIEPYNCSHVYDSQYCIKAVKLEGKLTCSKLELTSCNVFTGGIGTKRFCSSLDLGNYCNYVQQPGDSLLYRTCIYTCTGDGCNSAPRCAALGGSILFLLGGYIFRLLGFR